MLGAARSAPVLFLFVHPALLAMDATLEEAARMAGASAWRTVWRINFPLLLPALLASGILSFVVAMESFEIPQLLGTPANIFVFTTRIYDLAYGGHVANFGAAMVLALILLVLTGSLIVVQWRLLRGRAYTTVSGRGFKAQPLDLGAGRWVAFAVILGFFIVFGALPMVVLLLNSFMELSGFISWEMFTTQHWANALGRDDVLKSIRDTLMVGIAAASLGVVVSLFISYVVTRTAWGGLNAIVRVDPRTSGPPLSAAASGRLREPEHRDLRPPRRALVHRPERRLRAARSEAGTSRVFRAPRGAGPYGIATTPAGAVYYVSLAGSYLGASTCAPARRPCSAADARPGSAPGLVGLARADLGQRMECRQARHVRPAVRAAGASGGSRERPDGVRRLRGRSGHRLGDRLRRQRAGPFRPKTERFTRVACRARTRTSARSTAGRARSGAPSRASTSSSSCEPAGRARRHVQFEPLSIRRSGAGRAVEVAPCQRQRVFAAKRADPSSGEVVGRDVDAAVDPREPGLVGRVVVRAHWSVDVRLGPISIEVAPARRSTRPGRPGSTARR